MAADRVSYDEFGLFHENAAEFGLPYSEPPIVRRERVAVAPGRALSALVWGSDPPELVLLHGGAQNAHTWDTVAMAIGRPLVAIDLPGHGHSDGGAQGVRGAGSLAANAADIAEVIRRVAPRAEVVVGMSLGGLTTIALAAAAPDLVRRMVLVDITPGVTAHKAQAITAFVNGPKTFDSFDDLLARTIEFNPTRSVSSLRRGILHNALQLDDGSWVWRYRRFDEPPMPTSTPDATAARDETGEAGEVDYEALWSVLRNFDRPAMLVRGMRPQSVVDDADEQRFIQCCRHGRVERLAEAGHSVQGDTPLELAALLDDFVPRR